MSSRKIAAATVLSAALLIAGNATASEVTGSVTVVSDYLFRGITQTDQKPALQGGVTWTHDSGFYAGAWGSSISWLSDADPDVSSQVELDGFVGYAGSFGESGFGYDVGVNYYWYPGRYPAGFNSADTLELYAGLSYGIFSAKYYHATTDLFGVPGSRGSGDLDVAANWEFTPGWTLNAGLGKQWVRHHDDLDYSYRKLGATRAFGNGVSIAASWNDTDLHGLDDTFLVSISKAF